MKNPYPKTITDEPSGIEVSNTEYKIWDEGHKVGMYEVADWIQRNVGWRPDAPYKSTIDMDEWEDQLKKWGITRKA